MPLPAPPRGGKDAPERAWGCRTVSDPAPHAAADTLPGPTPLAAMQTLELLGHEERQLE